TWPSYRDFVEMALGAEDSGSWRTASPQFMNLPAGRTLPMYWVVHSPEDELVDQDQPLRFFEHLKTQLGQTPGEDRIFDAVESKRIHLNMSMANKHFEMLKEQRFLDLCVDFVQTGETLAPNRSK
ncbi:hypothetical protein HDU93_006492, partial [Gonapodya sp. JEL0774]